MQYFVKAGTLFLLSAPAISAQTVPDGEQSAEIVSGITDAFLGNSQISGEERRCLSNGASSFTSSLSEACEQALETYKQFTAPAMPPAPKMITTQVATNAAGTPSINQFASPVPASVAATPIVPTAMVSEGETAVMAMELAARLSQVYKVQTKVASSCLKGDVLDEFGKAENHLSNITYVGGRLLTHGVDVLDELKDAFKSLEHQNYRAFGKDLGTAGRKVLLSDHSGWADYKPPSFEVPSEEAVEEVTQGLFASFFGKGFDLQVVADDALQAAPVSTPQVPMSSASPGVLPGSPGASSAGATAFLATPAPAPVPATLNVDLHKCISDNMLFWKSAWAPVWDLASAAASGSESEVPDMSELTMSMMHVQMAMTRCKISPEMEAILLDSMEAGKLHAKLKMPESKFNKGTVPTLLSSALKDFKDKSWYAFGNQLGAAMQDLLVVSFDQKYEVDAAAGLHQRLPELGQFTSRRTAGATVAGAVSVGFLAMFAMVRGRRVVSAALGRPSSGRQFDRLDRAPVLLDDIEAIVE